MTVSNLLNKIINWGLIVLTFLLPLFFLPVLPDFYDLGKQGLLVLGTGLLLLGWAIKAILNHEVSFKRSPFDLAVLALAASFILSTVLISSNRMETLVIPGSTGTILGLTIFYFIITNNLEKSSLALLLNSLVASVSLLALVTLGQFFGAITKTFTPAGGLIPLLTLIIPVLFFDLVSFFSLLKKESSLAKKALAFLSVLILIAGLGCLLYQLSSGFPLLRLPFRTGWAIAVETLKQSPLLGVGPNNFLAAFTRFKPVDFNLHQLWSIRFAVSSNWYFQLLTTVGVFGLVSFLFLVYKIFLVTLKNFSPTEKHDEEMRLISIMTLLVGVLLAVFPPNFLLLFTFFILLGTLGALGSFGEFKEKSRLLPWIIFFPTLALVLIIFYMVGQDLRSNFSFQKSLEALGRNDGTQTYNRQIEAISQAPYRTSFRLAYSQTNLALANSLVTQKDLSDQDRQNISILVQQAIREGKAAVALSPQNVIAWENLANIYRNLINFAQGAENWTITTYQQAIALDPLNPNLRIAFGGVHYSLKNWEEAQRQFEIASQLKPDLANAYYNLAAALKEQAKFDRATTIMETVLSLVPKDSDDYKKAQSELEALKKRISEKEPKEGETLKGPEPAPKGIKPPLSLPTEAAPEISPTPTPPFQP